MTGSEADFVGLYLARTTRACHPQIVHLMELMRNAVPALDARLNLIKELL